MGIRPSQEHLARVFRDNSAHLGDQGHYVKVQLTSADNNRGREVLRWSLTSLDQVVPPRSQGLHVASVHLTLQPSLYPQGA